MVSWEFLWNRNAPNLDDQVTDWLSGNWSEEKYNRYLMYKSIPIVNNYFDYLTAKQDDKAYLRRYGMDYSDIKNPQNLRSSNAASRFYGSAYSMVSRNYAKLYR